MSHETRDIRVLCGFVLGVVLLMGVCFCGSYALAEESASEVSTSASPDSTQAPESGEVLQVVTLDDARAMVDYAVVETGNAQLERQDATMAVLSDKVDGMDAAVRNIAKAVSEDESASTSAVVVLDGEQWDTLQRCWGFAKGAGVVCLFTLVSCTIFVCVLVGQRIWDAFSRGWRH